MSIDWFLLPAAFFFKYSNKSTKYVTKPRWNVFFFFNPTNSPTPTLIFKRWILIPNFFILYQNRLLENCNISYYFGKIFACGNVSKFGNCYRATPKVKMCLPNISKPGIEDIFIADWATAAWPEYMETGIPKLEDKPDIPEIIRLHLFFLAPPNPSPWLLLTRDMPSVTQICH